MDLDLYASDIIGKAQFEVVYSARDYALCNDVIIHGASIRGIWVLADHTCCNGFKQNASMIFELSSHVFHTQTTVDASDIPI